MSDPKPLTPEEEAYLRSLDTLEGLGPRMVARLLATLDAERAARDFADQVRISNEVIDELIADERAARPDGLREAWEALMTDLGRLAGNPIQLPAEIVHPLIDKARLLEPLAAPAPALDAERLREAARKVLDGLAFYIPHDGWPPMLAERIAAMEAALASPERAARPGGLREALDDIDASTCDHMVTPSMRCTLQRDHWGRDHLSIGLWLALYRAAAALAGKEPNP